LLTGGGDRSLGDIGQRGVSLGSDVTDAFCATGARIKVGSEAAGCSLGIAAVESALCCAAAEGGLIAERAGLTSFALFFLDLPGPDVRGIMDLSEGLTGDDSREGKGEFVADVARFDWSLFVDGTEDVDGIDAGAGADSLAFEVVAGVVESIGSAVSCAVSEMDRKSLSSMVAFILVSISWECSHRRNY